MVNLAGWALFEDDPVSRVEGWLGDAPLGRARLGLPRPDVAGVHADPEAPACGFELRAGLEAPAEDTAVELRVVATSLDGRQQQFGPVPATLAARSRPEPGPPRAAPSPRSGEGRRLLAFSNVLTLGGAALHLYDLLTEARRQGRLQPTVATAIDGPLRRDLETGGVPVHLLGSASARRPRGLSRPGRGDRGVGGGRRVRGGARQHRHRPDPARSRRRPHARPTGDLVDPRELPPGAALGRPRPGPARARRSEAGGSEAAPSSRARGPASSTRSVLDRSTAIPYGLDLAPIEAVRQGFERDRARRELGIDAGADLADLRRDGRAAQGAGASWRAPSTWSPSATRGRSWPSSAATRVRTRRCWRPASPPPGTASGCGWCRGPARCSAGIGAGRPPRLRLRRRVAAEIGAGGDGLGEAGPRDRRLRPCRDDRARRQRLALRARRPRRPDGRAGPRPSGRMPRPGSESAGRPGSWSSLATTSAPTPGASPTCSTPLPVSAGFDARQFGVFRPGSRRG